MSAQRKISDLSSDLADRAESFCAYFFPNGRKQGNYWQIGDTSGAAGQSLAVRLQSHGGRKAGAWTDFASDEYGDLIDLLHANLGSPTLGDTLRIAQSFLGEAPAPGVSNGTTKSSNSPAVSSSIRIAQGRKLFSYGRTILGTPAAAYLSRRGITRLGPALRYHPRVFLRSDTHAAGPPDQHPALLAKITNDRGMITGCARTFLNPDTGAISDLERPKRILGQLHGNAIRFGSGPFGADLIVGEGLENTLSVGSALPEYDLAACLTANHLAVFIPPVSVQRIWIARDGDDVGAQAALRLSRRLIPEGYFCGDLVPTLGDFNDDLLRFGKEALRQSLLLAMKEQRRSENEE